MKILKCKICKSSEIELINHDRSVHKKVKCCKCGFSNTTENSKKNTEIVIIRRPNRK